MWQEIGQKKINIKNKTEEKEKAEAEDKGWGNVEKSAWSEEHREPKPSKCKV